MWLTNFFLITVVRLVGFLFIVVCKTYSSIVWVTLIQKTNLSDTNNLLFHEELLPRYETYAWDCLNLQVSPFLTHRLFWWPRKKVCEWFNISLHNIHNQNLKWRGSRLTWRGIRVWMLLFFVAILDSRFTSVWTETVTRYLISLSVFETTNSHRHVFCYQIFSTKAVSLTCYFFITESYFFLFAMTCVQVAWWCKFWVRCPQYVDTYVQR